ncbi:hypothetical protein [Rubrivirga sp.]|uniref:hypothetical protein n=1 Tax=Rubrivirga sp. TaxID=1885344 RepID=UPI003C75927E
MPDTATSRYVPIACSLHDRLESWAVHRTPVEVVWRDGETERVLEAVISDVFARDGADWVVLEGEPTIRADRLVRVGGVAMNESC